MQSQRATASQSASQSGTSYESPYTIFQPVQSCQLKFSDPTTPFQHAHSNPALPHGFRECRPQTTDDTQVQADTSPEESQNRILDLMQHYPSAGFSQGVAFIVVTYPIVQKRLKNSSRPYEAPLMIVPCVSEKLYHDRYRESDKLRPDGTEIDWPTPYWHFDVGCACMIIFLTAVNEGLASALAGAFRPDLLRKELGILPDFHPVGIISIGYPDLERDTPSPSLKRGHRPKREVIHYNNW